MNKKFVPFVHAKNLFEIPIDFYSKIGIKNILLDLDNTLDSYLNREPTNRALDYVNQLKTYGYHVFIISNNHKKRVSKYASSLGINYLHKSFKPFVFRIKKYFQKNKFQLDNTIMIGDQILTDIKCANKLKIKSIYLDKLVLEDQWTTRINRFFENIVLKKLLKNKLLIDWRIIYGKN